MTNPTFATMPFGLRQVRVSNMAGTLEEDFDAAQEFTFEPEWTTAKQRGNDRTVGSFAHVSGGKGEFMDGKLSTTARAIVFGGTITQTGTSPNEQASMKWGGDGNMPYFKLQGKVMTESGGDLHIVIYKCMAVGGGNLEFKDGEFWSPGFEFEAVYDDVAGCVWEEIAHETTTALSSIND